MASISLNFATNSQISDRSLCWVLRVTATGAVGTNLEGTNDNRIFVYEKMADAPNEFVHVATVVDMANLTDNPDDLLPKDVQYYRSSVLIASYKSREAMAGGIKAIQQDVSNFMASLGQLDTDVDLGDIVI